jgi:hypothetical protein
MLVWHPHQALPAARITGMIPEWKSADFAAAGQGRAVKPLWWLTYRRDGELSGVVIVEGQALIDARMQASLRGLEEGVAFVEGHRLDDAASKAMVPTKAIGRMLSIAEAKTVLKQIDGRSR